MILPIYTYGQSVLRERAAEVEQPSPQVDALVANMVETMHHAAGIGLAAPQVGQSLRIFVIDVSHLAEEIEEEYDGSPPPVLDGPVVFVNPVLKEIQDSETCDFEEGCLSIPNIREFVDRPEAVHVSYQTPSFESRDLLAVGLLARVIQHEYDHLEGVLFIDHLTALRRRLLRRRLRQIAAGDVDADYPLSTSAEV